MIAMDFYWRSNPDWHEIKKLPNGKYTDVLKPDAPKEARESYERCLEQARRAAELERETGAHVI